MLYQLQDGRTIEISMHEYLSCTDEELRQLIGTNYGMEINNPQYGSIITKPGRAVKDEEVEDYSNMDIQDVPHDEKFKDRDYTEDE